MNRKNGWTVSLFTLALTLCLAAQGQPYPNDPNAGGVPVAPHAASRFSKYYYAAVMVSVYFAGLEVDKKLSEYSHQSDQSQDWEELEAMFQSRHYDSARFKELVDMGADKDYLRVTMRDPLNENSFHQLEDALDAIQILVDAGACSGRYPQEGTFRYPALSLVTASRDINLIAAFLDDCMDLEAVAYSGTEGSSPLGCAIFWFRDSDELEKVIGMLLEAGAGVNDTGSFPALRPLQEAIGYVKDLEQRERVIRMLFEAGAEVYFKDVLMSITGEIEAVYVRDVHWNTKNLRQLKLALSSVLEKKVSLELNTETQDALLRIAHHVVRESERGNIQPLFNLELALSTFIEEGVVPEFDSKAKDDAMSYCEDWEDYESCRDVFTLRVRLDSIQDVERREAIIRMLGDAKNKVLI